MSKQEYNYQVFYTGPKNNTFIPEPYDSLGQLSESGCQEMTIEGIERSVKEGGGCTRMDVNRGEEKGDAFDTDQAEPYLITSKGEDPFSISSNDERGTGDSSDAGSGTSSESEEEDIQTTRPSLRDPKEDIEGIASVMGGLVTEQEYFEVPQMVQKEVSALHGEDECPQIFMFAQNHQDVISKVFHSGKKSDLFVFVNPLSVVTMGGYARFTSGGYGQEISPVVDNAGEICGVVQKDPEDDPAPCGSEYRFEASDDKTYWKTIRIISPPKPEIVATAEFTAPEANAEFTSGKRSTEPSDLSTQLKIKRMDS